MDVAVSRDGLPTRRFDFRSEEYPVELEFLHPTTRQVVWCSTLERPPEGETAVLRIPKLGPIDGPLSAFGFLCSGPELYGNEANPQ